MLQTAVFVDAGYLFAQGGLLITGRRTTRSELSLNASAAVTKFREVAALAAPEIRLLRMYWYDGLIRGGQPTAEQTALARSNDVKLRFGMVNSHGQQKGVDSLIVTDLIELARNHAISDALIMSGDEDIRVGVQIAATFGVRIHLVGIKPALGSQSPDLVAEADTHREWTLEDLSALLIVREARPDGHDGTPVAGQTFAALVEVEINERLANLNGIAIAGSIVANNGSIPPDLDRPALAALRDRLARDLTYRERTVFRDRLRERILAQFPVG